MATDTLSNEPGTLRDARAASSAAFATALEPVRRKFIDTIEERILAIEGLRQDIGRNRDVDASVRAVAGIAHKLSGVSATLGFARVGALAATAESMLSAEGSRLTAADRWALAADQVENLLDALESILDT
jgi:HPt (histidine-containing phosphotransfer) domain-containing protein